MKQGKENASQALSFDVRAMMQDTLGEGYGFTVSELNAMNDRAQQALQSVQQNRGTGMVGWTESPYNQDEVMTDVENIASHIRANFETFVVLGIGGSALGPIAVHQALSHLRYNELPTEKRNGPKFYVEDNIDPERMSALLDVIDVSKTCFNIITKSGTTAETMSQYVILSTALKEAVGEDWAKHIVATTDKENGNLIRMAKEFGFQTLCIPASVGGRFSEMTPVGLLAAAVCGIDIRSIIEGAKAMDERSKNTNLWENPALLQAVMQYLCMTEKGLNVQVIMPYADSLKYMADWVCQLWAESLGKNVTRKGVPCNVGQTPTKALGVTDQHSQLQLYTEGPFDKIVTFLRVGAFRKTVVIPTCNTGSASVDFLGGKTLNQLLDAELKGTEFALCKAHRMNQTIILPEVNAYTVGQLLYFYQMTTAFTGELLDIDAYNQPGVEESKIASYAVLGSEEEKYQKKREEMQIMGEPNPMYTL